MTDYWWRDFETRCHCHHPHKYRGYTTGLPPLERCFFCGETRPLADAGSYWPSVTKRQSELPKTP